MKNQMQEHKFLTIEQNKCIKCLQCLRSCSVNAIRYVDNNLFIHPERCVKCGKCYEHCPSGAINIKDVISSVKKEIADNKTVVASISPTWVSEFRGVSMSQIVTALKMLGFSHVSQATHGASTVIEETKNTLQNKKPLVISSICPVVNRLIETYYPKYIEYLNPILTPETLHSKMVKKWYGENTKVIYISSCIASYENKELDGAITYSELKSWFQEQMIDVFSIPSDTLAQFEPMMANNYHNYQLVSSAISYFPETDVQSSSGLNRVMKILNDINTESIEDKVYLELFACDGGCLTSVGSIDKNNILAKKLRFDKHKRDSKKEINYTLPKVEFKTERFDRRIKHYAQEQEKEEILRRMNISKSGSLLNCSACGYVTCDSFANAVVLNMAEISTCVWHQKNSIQNNLNTIIEQIPYGFFIINKEMQFTNINDIFCKTIGIEKDVLLSTKISIDKLISFSNEINSVFKDQISEVSHKIIINDNEMKLNLVTLQDGELIFGCLRNFLSSSAFDDEYVESVKTIIRTNIYSVQKIATLLGENISRTESLLSSIVENK